MKHIITVGILFMLSLLQTIQAKGKDEYWYAPKAGPEERKEIFLQYYAEHGRKDFLTGIFNQIARVAIGQPMEDEPTYKAIALVRSNRDCNDFSINGMLRLLYMDREKTVIPAHLKKEIEACVLDFKYWWDDGRRDTTYRCYHTENHQALYHTAELLAGQLYKDRIFTNGMNGIQHMQHAKERLDRWLDFRFRFGFSEWLSTYYEVEAMLLTNLYDYAEDKTIRQKAGMVLDLLMFDMALNNFEGMMGSTSGRMYAHSLIDGSHNTSPLTKLMFGVGTFDRDEVMAPIALSTSKYQCPKVIQEIAIDYQRPMLNRQRISINVEDAPSYGLSYDNELDCHLFWGMQEFIHPLAIKMSKQISEKYDTWPYRNYDQYIRKYEEQIKTYGKLVNSHFDRFALSEANVETYRTSEYMLSSVQDYRPGAPGYQQHIWQATLGNRAIVYTNHPGGKNLKYSPNYWAGNEILPRAAQHKNVVVCIYNIPENQKNDYTHAYFPKNDFDEVLTKGNWTFGRKKDGYVALYSQNTTTYQAGERGDICDLLASGRQNIWICETGTKTEWGDFTKFVNAISSSEVSCQELNVNYTSPSIGKVTFGWKSPFTINGKEQKLRWKYRYDNPYCKALFNSRKIEIKKGSEKLILDSTKL